MGTDVWEMLDMLCTVAFVSLPDPQCLPGEQPSIGACTCTHGLVRLLHNVGLSSPSVAREHLPSGLYAG